MSPTATKIRGEAGRKGETERKSETERKAEAKRKAEIAHILSGEGAHAVMMLPTLEGNDFAMSPFELFVLDGTEIIDRVPLNQCYVHTNMNQDGTEQFNLATSSSVNATFYASEHQGKLMAEQDSTREFESVANSSPFFLKWNFLWTHTLLSEFAIILRDWHIWSQISTWGKYPASSIVSFGTSEFAEDIGRVFGKSLFTSLDTFLISPVNENPALKDLRCGIWEDGITPSLHTVTEMLDKISVDRTVVPMGWETQSAFSDEQRKALNRIQRELKQYKKSEFWKNLVCHPDFDRGDKDKSLDLLIQMADDQTGNTDRRPELLSTYIHTARNAMAHNSKHVDLQEFYLLRVGYEGFAEKLVGEAIEKSFSFLYQLYTDVFGLQGRELCDWKELADKNAAKTASQILSGMAKAGVS